MQLCVQVPGRKGLRDCVDIELNYVQSARNFLSPRPNSAEQRKDNY